MSQLLDQPPFGPRADDVLLDEMVVATKFHLEHSPAYRSLFATWTGANTLADIPFVHAGVFKHIHLTSAPTGRTLVSSGTRGAQSRISVEGGSSKLQAKSSRSILADFIDSEPRPLLILDHADSLRSRDAVPARVAAAMALHPFASSIHFVLDGDGKIKWQAVQDVVDASGRFLVYSITSALWTEWVQTLPVSVRASTRQCRAEFVHSGGWKRLEALRVDRAELDRALLGTVGAGSRVLDFYGLVEQTGILFPLCDAGARHVPAWAEVIARDPFTLQPLFGEMGLLQLMNPIPRGAPTHSVLTEDLGRLLNGMCDCGRNGRRFELIGRLPKAEARGCANV